MLIPFQYIDELINTCLLIFSFSYIYAFSFSLYTAQHKSEGQRTTCGCWLPPPALRVLGMSFGLAGLAASTFAHFYDLLFAQCTSLSSSL